jgi:hypothetical protein
MITWERQSTGADEAGPNKESRVDTTKRAAKVTTVHVLPLWRGPRISTKGKIQSRFRGVPKPRGSPKPASVRCRSGFCRSASSTKLIPVVEELAPVIIGVEELTNAHAAAMDLRILSRESPTDAPFLHPVVDPPTLNAPLDTDRFHHS